MPRSVKAHVALAQEGQSHQRALTQARQEVTGAVQAEQDREVARPNMGRPGDHVRVLVDVTKTAIVLSGHSGRDASISVTPE
jgi:hypothetical protein